ncbi:hypothetical protein NUW58_g8256 [Xylaria curta]|uniref:Uncharacterized protein n=1 Tax=Xylaria curta TaxID=42375 RepID=A0ACC1N917_9PEZI|nr:hypothetical protein NUW58_g8256 [Xylaria curta]
MNETIAINRSLDNDARSIDLPFIGAPSEIDSTPALVFPWADMHQGMRYSPGLCLGNATGEAVQDAPAFDRFDDRYGLGSDPAEPPFLARERTIQPLTGELEPLDTSDFVTRQQSLAAETVSDLNEIPSLTFTQPSPASTRSTRYSSSISPITPADSGGAPDTRQHRERNRVAARKCREKAKKNATSLQQREKELCRQNKMLQKYVSSLRHEILDLKTEILRHSGCNSSVIQDYIERAARRRLE